MWGRLMYLCFIEEVILLVIFIVSNSYYDTCSVFD